MRLARGLARDEDEARDLVQETWLQALRRGGRGVRDPRAFLRGPLRLLAVRRRSDGRARRERERLGSRPLHCFLDANPELLRSETHADFLSERSFEIRSGARSRIRPDSILKPVECDRTRFALVELKLPSHRVLVGRGESLRFSRGLLRAVDQVRTYRDRLLGAANAEEVERRAGMVPEQYDVAVLIGMRRADEGPGTLDELRAAHDVVDVSIIRYDELAEQGMKLGGRESPIMTA